MQRGENRGAVLPPWDVLVIMGFKCFSDLYVKTSSAFVTRSVPL